jgi:hypothetical protein
MSDSLHIELTTDQRDVLLQGLRFVRSSIMMEMRDSTPEDESFRTNQLEDIAQLVQQLNGNTPNTPTRTPAEV